MAQDKPTDTELAESRELSGRIFAVADLARQTFADVSASHGLTAQQARTVLLLEDPQPMSAIAEHLRCDPSNVTGLADRLERAGTIERIPGPDRRTRLLRLTRDGRRLRARLATSVAKRSTLTARLSRPERAQLALLLDKVLAD
jgi:DNA-binding MarR family transcriptional regulator